MNIKLYQEPNEKYNALTQVLTNRGIKQEDILAYINTDDSVINPPELLGEENLINGAKMLVERIQNDDDILIIVDADCDGFTSSAILINWIYKAFPSFAINHINWFLHDGKQHGLADCIDIAKKYKLVICPDSSSNDYKQHEELFNLGIDVLVIDHHEAEEGASKYACTINNQLSNYPNKEFSGAGITWQFCRYLDKKLKTSYSNDLLDLVALGNTADMMSLLSLETKHIINKGFLCDNIKNPFIYGMWQKNKFKLGEDITSWGAAFYIAPLVNAIVRSGNDADKEQVFNSMLDFKAYEMQLSTKRGHSLNEKENLLTAALRTCTNVKNHQTKAEKQGMEFLENKIKEHNLLNNKVLVFLLKPGEIDPNIAGLAANKIAPIYFRPVCVLTYRDGEYAGSARGCDSVGITNFKDICADTGVTTFVAGHQGAFGIGIKEEDIQIFIERVNEALKDVNTEPVYMCDYCFDNTNVDENKILDIANMDKYWGKNVPESLVAIKNLKITSDMIKLKSADKNPTLEIKLNKNCCIIKFNSSQEEYEQLLANTGYVEINLIGTCDKNEWMGNITAQIKLKDYEIIDRCAYYF